MSVTLILPLTATARMSRKSQDFYYEKLLVSVTFKKILFTLFPISQVWLGSTTISFLSRVILSVLRGKIE